MKEGEGGRRSEKARARGRSVTWKTEALVNTSPIPESVVPPRSQHAGSRHISEERHVMAP